MRNHLQNALVELRFEPLPDQCLANLPAAIRSHYAALFAAAEQGSLDEQIDHVCVLLAMLSAHQRQLSH